MSKNVIFHSFIVDLPIKHGDFPSFLVSLPEAKNFSDPLRSRSKASTTAGQADVAAAGRGMLDAVLRVEIPVLPWAVHEGTDLVNIEQTDGKAPYF